jgi:ribosome biogenesis protein BMS1
VARKADLDQKRLHVPLADRSLLEPPPVLIAVVGPPKVCLHFLTFFFSFIFHSIPLLSEYFKIKKSNPQFYFIFFARFVQVGKSTLIRSLIKRYTKQNVADVKGPITVVSGKSRRLTFIECGNDMNSMIDCAKSADLVLLLIDASFGFEMVR